MTTTRFFSKPDVIRHSRQYIFKDSLRTEIKYVLNLYLQGGFFFLLMTAVYISAKGTECSLSQGSSNYYQLWTSALYNSPVWILPIVICQSFIFQNRELFKRIFKSVNTWCIVNALKHVFFFTKMLPCFERVYKQNGVKCTDINCYISFLNKWHLLELGFVDWHSFSSCKLKCQDHNLGFFF